MKKFIAIAALGLLAACSNGYRDADGGMTINARPPAPLYAVAGGALGSGYGGWRIGICNETDLSECGGTFDKADIQTAAKAGKLRFRYPDGSTRTYK